MNTFTVAVADNTNMIIAIWDSTTLLVETRKKINISLKSN